MTVWLRIHPHTSRGIAATRPTGRRLAAVLSRAIRGARLTNQGFGGVDWMGVELVTPPVFQEIIRAHPYIAHRGMNEDVQATYHYVYGREKAKNGEGVTV